MKKIFLALGILSLSLFASSGEEIYKKSCVACHTLKPGEVNIKDLKAPPMAEVSARLKFVFKNDKKKMVDFIKDYIENPSKDKSKCMPMAVSRFGVMPPIGKSLTKEEREVIAKWIYDNFKTKWKDSEVMKGCKGNMKGIKEGSKDKMKPAMHKCGSGSGKCGAGKCGAK